MPDFKMPPERDFGFYQRRKHDKWRAVPAPDPALEAPVADTHAHIHMLPDPAWELARCAANGVDYACLIVDPSEDGFRPLDELETWQMDATEAFQAGLRENLPGFSENALRIWTWANPASGETAEIGQNRPENGSNGAVEASKSTETESEALPKSDFLPGNGKLPANFAIPTVSVAVGVHPHNAKRYDDALEARIAERLSDARVVALGEIGLDYHYDLSPRDVQREVFRRQIHLAQQHDLPIALHLRGGEDPQADNAHREAFAILREEGALGPRALLHCCALPPDELRPWVEAGCYIAYGGALTFKNADAAREGALLVPPDRLLLETDSPYMTPEPMRGTACTPAHVVFTAAVLAQVRGVQPGDDRRAFLQQLHDNTLAFFEADVRQGVSARAAVQLVSPRQAGEEQA